jgi:hypothetical protein
MAHELPVITTSGRKLSADSGFRGLSGFCLTKKALRDLNGNLAARYGCHPCWILCDGVLFTESRCRVWRRSVNASRQGRTYLPRTVWTAMHGAGHANRPASSCAAMPGRVVLPGGTEVRAAQNLHHHLVALFDSATEPSEAEGKNCALVAPEGAKGYIVASGWGLGGKSHPIPLDRAVEEGAQCQPM